MLKFLLGVAIVAFTSFCGHLLAQKYRKRQLFFKQLKEFNERFLSEIAYYRRPLREFASNYSYQGEFQELLNDYFTAIDKRKPINCIFSENERYRFLKEEELRVIEDYFLMLGKGDSSSQKGYFSCVREKLHSFDEESEKDAKRYGDLFIKLGFLCGLLFLILII